MDMNVRVEILKAVMEAHEHFSKNKKAVCIGEEDAPSLLETKEDIFRDIEVYKVTYTDPNNPGCEYETLIDKTTFTIMQTTQIK